MAVWVLRVWKASAGKRTYLVAGTIAAVTMGLLLAHRLTPTAAAAVLCFGVPLLGAGYRHALERHRAEMIQFLAEAAVVGGAIAGRQLPVAIAGAEAAFNDGAKLVTEVRVEVAEEKAGQ